MNLVNELQVSVEKDDVLTVLRKARRLAAKLAVNDISGWLTLEQNGYAGAVEVPAYRHVKGHLVINTNGPIPMGMGLYGTGVMDYPGGVSDVQPMRESMGELVSILGDGSKTEKGIYLTLNNDEMGLYRQVFTPHVARQVIFMLRLNESQIRAIPEAVKDRILDWALALESRGVHGENMTFNEAERQAAHQVNFNLSNCTIDQLTNSGNNSKR